MTPLPRVVSDDEIAAYQSWLESIAWRFAGHPPAYAEFDDLMQEGRIAVWESLQDGFRPSELVVIDAMREWVRRVTAQRFGHGSAGESVLAP